ncbi:MAG: M48 family metalloprotease [Pyrinomonadaceae bacterium]|nr:M48 family metalloprotease [Pyrinomonadaceae bacterium]
MENSPYYDFKIDIEMRLIYLSACFALFCIAVCPAPSSASNGLAAETAETENARPEPDIANPLTLNVAPLTLNEERAVGQRLAYLYAQRHSLSGDVRMQERLNRIATRMCAAFEMPVPDIMIVKSSQAEAVSFPPNRIFITSTLVKLARSDDELAAVIAHEAAHVRRRHLAHLIRLSLTLTAGERAYFPTRAAIVTGQIVQFAFPPSLDTVRLRYEMEADRQAVLWLERAGYESLALSSLLESLATRLSPQEFQESESLRARIALLAPETAVVAAR